MKSIPPTLLGSNNNIIVTNTDSMFYFVPIPKNASSHTYYFLKKYGWLYYQYDEKEELDNKIPFTVIREPIERWCSGFAQDYHLYNNYSIDLDNEDMLDKLFNDNINFGLHCVPQAFYLKNLDFNKVYFFKHDDMYSSNLENFTLNIMKQHIRTRMKKFTSNMDYAVKNKIKTILDKNPKYMTLLKKYLEEDLDIYSSVKFYKG
jgi:hypothetical protein